tara:strand:+ start:226 stop:615 length:390 start_codon:yes stop_codon:yes gene_type:complete
MKEDKNLDDFLPDKKSSYYKLLNKDINSDKKVIKEDVIGCISTVMDPEIPVNVYDLGLIYSITINNNNVTIDMTLTNPNCPVAGQIPQNVGKSVEVLENLKSVKVNLVWSPPWSENMMSEDAKLALDIF